MNWNETRQALIKIHPKYKDLPEQYEWGINLRGANLGGAYLRGADLDGADLCDANLRGANLRGADLGDANLGDAYLRGANLGDAYLGGANLRGANLDGAHLCGADLCGANLGGAIINWNSHDLIVELLKRAAGDDIDKLKLTGLILLMREWCWGKFLKLDEPLAEWALGVLAEYVKDGDNAPAVLRRMARKAKDGSVKNA